VTTSVATWRRMWAWASHRVVARRQEIDKLNVFPVPDGDTGHNLAGTLVSAVHAMRATSAEDFARVTDALARGALEGARGNSGVILSQWVRGLAELAGPMPWDADGFARALAHAADTAYRQVAHPVEGTILSVARAAAQGAEGAGDWAEVLAGAEEAARRALSRTTAQLAALAAAEVVDAGGLGLVELLTGLRFGLTAQDDPASPDLAEHRLPAAAGPGPRILRELSRPYDVEALISRGPNAPEVSAWTSRLEALGDSVVVARGADGLLKVHVHTDRPAELVTQLAQWGDLVQLELLDMRRQGGGDQPTTEAALVPHLAVAAEWHGLVKAAGWEPVLPEDDWDRAGTVSVSDDGILQHALAAPDLGHALIALEQYWPGPWPEVRSVMAEAMAGVRWLPISCEQGTFRVGDRIMESQAAVFAFVAEAGHAQVVTVYVGEDVTAEEVRGWQEQAGAEVVVAEELPVWAAVVLS
jgi:dihydroxyacetone kinase-like predicted kinase